MKRFLAILAACLAAIPAQAVTITRSFNISASNFTNFFAEAAPFSSISGDFTITYDTATPGVLRAPDAFRFVTDGRVNDGPFSATPVAGYFGPVLSSAPRIVIGGALNGANVGLSGTDDFTLIFDADKTGAMGPTFDYFSFSFTVANRRAPFMVTNAVIRETTIAAAVAEPATWATMILGFGAIGHAMRRRAYARPAFRPAERI